MNEKELKKIVNRFRRIGGQIRGLEKMIESEAPCLDILTQVSAVTAAIKKAGAEVVHVYIEHCLTETSGKPEREKTQKMDEFQKAIARYIDMT